MSLRKIAVIDYTDICLSDFARDIGSFLQQLEYMCNRKINNLEFTDRIKKIFLETYLTYAKIQLNEPLKKRIENYYNWTVIRTATYFLIKDKPEPKRAEPLINKISKNM